MQIFKFGGSSLNSASRIRSVASIIGDKDPKIVVLSANGKSTDYFEDMGIHLAQKNYDEVLQAKNKLLFHYFELIDELFTTREHHTKAKEYIFYVFSSIQKHYNEAFTANHQAWLLTQGEMISSVLFSLFLESISCGHHFMFASEIIQKGSDGQINTNVLAENLKGYIEANDTFPLIITQGFICSTELGFPDTLGRGGSDFTASLLGQACEASVIQIWSDVDGFLNNDPSVVRGVLPLSNLSYEEAEELAYFGARILHPMTIAPAKAADIPVLLKNTLNPAAKGTLISGKVQAAGIKAAASKDGISLITVHSARMLMATGFLKVVFEVFERHHTAVDMVTTSEVSISLTIDNSHALEEILSDLSSLGEVSWQENLSILCVVGDQLAENRGDVDLIFSTLRDIPSRMISYGAARNSISLLLETKDKLNALELLNPVILKILNPHFSHA